jgi:hypothetical protein
MHPGQLVDQFVLCRGGARQQFGQRVDLRHSFGGVGRERPARFRELRQAGFLLRQRGLVAHHFRDARARLLEPLLQHRKAVVHREQLALQRGDRLQFLLGVDHLGDDAVQLRLQRIEFHAPRQLLSHLGVDFRRDQVQAIQPGFQHLHDLRARGNARQACIELGGDFADPGRAPGPLFDQRHLLENSAHRRLQFRDAGPERRKTIRKALERHPIGPELVAELRRLSIRLVEILDFLAQGLEVRAALLQALELRRRPGRHILDLAEALAQHLEVGLSPRQVISLCRQRFELTAEFLKPFREMNQLLFADGQRFEPGLGRLDGLVQRTEPLLQHL